MLKILNSVHSGTKQGVARFGVRGLSVSMLTIKAMNTLTASPGFHSSFVKSDGSLWTTGNNEEGQLGINSQNDANISTEVSIGSLSMMVSIGNPMSGPDLYINLVKHETFLEEQGSSLQNAQNMVSRMQELKTLSQTANSTDVSLYNVEFSSLQRQLYDISNASIGSEPLFAKYATDANASISSTPAVFGGQNQNSNLDHTFEIQVKEVGEDVSLGGSVSLGSVSLGMLNLFAINRGPLLSSLTIDTVSLGSSAFWSYNWNTSANGSETNHFIATLAVPSWGQTVQLNDISLGVLDQAATNLAFLRSQNGSELTELRGYHSKKVDYEVAKVATGGGHSIFILKGDFAYTTGRGGSGQLANGSSNNQSNYSFALSNVKHAAAGENHSLFLRNDGSLYGSGGNDSGQLGLNHENNRTYATQILGSGVKSIAAGFNHSLVVKEDGSLWGTGANNNSQLGLNDSLKRNQLTQIVSSGVRSAAAGNAFSLFLEDNGSLWGMGASPFGQLGMGDLNVQNTPVKIVSSGVRQISAGQSHSLYLKNDGSVWGMGLNQTGQLGLGTLNQTNIPVELFKSGAKEIHAGRHHSLVLLMDGTLWGSGQNFKGELGLGDLLTRNTFTQIATGVMRLADVMSNEQTVSSASNMEMIWVEPGTFTMGSPVGETGRSSNETEHNVTLTKGFYLGKYEVTQAQYEAVMNSNSNGLSPTPSQYSGNPNRPVEKVSWDSVQIFLARLNSAEQTAGRLPAGWSYVLPTESQWEYACRAGTATVYSWGNTIATSNANYFSNIGQTSDVGQYAANPWGFFDMHGLIWEWCADRYGTYPTGNPVIDPPGAASGSTRVRRGGSWLYAGSGMRSASRSYFAPSSRSSDIGFRVGFQQITTLPSNLNPLSSLSFAENQPIGTVVGEFNATDPDANATLTYHLVSGVGDGNNTLFTLETNGTLKTATTFDYETNASTYTIRVQAKDEYNATVEGNFTVTLMNLNESATGSVTLIGSPIVGQTLTASNSLTDPDGMGIISYQWQRNGSPIVLGGDLKSGENGVSGMVGSRNSAVSPDGYHVYVGGYSDGTISWFKRDPHSGNLQFGGKLTQGVNGVDGLTSVAGIGFSPGGEHVYISSGWGGNAISWYDRNASSGALTWQGVIKDDQGGADGLYSAGKLVVSPEGTHIYVTAYDDDALSWYQRDPVSGALTWLGFLKDGVNGVDGLDGARDLLLSNDGEFLYVSGAVDSSIAWFDRNESTGALAYLGLVRDGANGVDGLGAVTSIASNPSGSTLYASSQHDHSVTWFDRNASTGSLTYVNIIRNGDPGINSLNITSSLETSPDGKHLYCTGGRTDGNSSVNLFDINSSTGGLIHRNSYVAQKNGDNLLNGIWSFSLSPDGRNLYASSSHYSSVAWFVRDGILGELLRGTTGGTSHLLSTADQGAAISLQVSYTDGGGYSESLSSSPTANVNAMYQPSRPPHFASSAANLEMIWVEPGTFTMGSPTSEANRDPNETEHNVTLTKGFYLGKYELTQAQYQAVMTGNGNGLSATPSIYSGNPNHPVEKVSWNDAQIFLSRLNSFEHMAGRLPAGWSYVLPTESQWEYACRAGTVTIYSWGNSIAASNANYDQSGIGNSRQVGKYAANPWGFYDMHGNVSEWIRDWWGGASSGASVSDPTGPSSGSSKIRRGGGFNYPAEALRSAKRMGGAGYSPNDRYLNLGFRVSYQQVNIPPTNLNALTPLTIAENQPIGTVVGEFNATDPDANATLTYHLVSGVGDGNNSLFNLESNGTLKTATTFNYETNASTYTIRVQAKDEFNATVDGNFTVSLTDVLEYPIYLGFDGNGSTQTIVTENNRNVIPMPFSQQSDGNLTFTIGGSDASWFELVGNQGFRFIGLPDFELPLDQGGDNIYDLSLTASYSNNLSTSRLNSVQVVDANETSWTFTNASATGQNGPTQAQLDSAYANTPLAGKVTSLQGIQQWTPPFRGDYYVRAFGAAGSLSSGNRGKGAMVAGKFTLEQNDTVTMAIGQMGTSTAGPGGGGGGGSFFVINGVPMLIAGGGGGHGGNKDSLNSAAHAPITGNGLTSNNSYQGGMQGNGGNGADAGGGGGFLTDGQNGGQATGGKSFVNGAQGGYKTAGTYGGDGGFGGGGGGKYKDGNLYGSLHDGGGGGGYSGGAGGVSNTGGGGGSYNIGLDPMGIAGHHLNHGNIEITLLGADPYSINLNSTAPLIIAENQPVGTTVGEFNATDSNNSTVVYSLIQLGGAPLNQYFALDSSGVLRTTAVLDYEQANNITIRVQATGLNGNSFFRDFQVQVQDVLENIWTVPNAGTWLGPIADKNTSNWIFHDSLGWAYKGAADMNSTWMNLPDLGWVWTSSTVFPRFFSRNLSDWIHLVTPHPYNLTAQDFNASRIEKHPPRFYHTGGSTWLDFKGTVGIFDNFNVWGQSAHFAGSVGKNQTWFFAHRELAQHIQDDWRPLNDIWPTSTPNSLNDSNISMSTLPPLSPNIPSHPSAMRLSSVTSKVSASQPAIVGLVVEGNHSMVALRGLVPFVYQSFGPVQAKITDPVLELYDLQNSLLASNDDWQTGSNLFDLNRSGLAPTRQKESALVANLSTGAHSVILKGKSPNLELGLLELNSLETKLGSTMNMVSIRAVEPTARFVLEGTVPRKILLVAKGAVSLSGMGIINAAENPTLSIFGGWLKSGYNSVNFSTPMVDNWEDHFRAGEVNATGYAPSAGSNESAILLHLNPGVYEVTVGDANSTSSDLNQTSILEIYDLGDGRNPVQYPPHSFKLSNFSIARKQPVSTVVGELSAIDPEAPDEQVTFALVSGSGDTHNNLFEIVYTDYGYDMMTMTHKKSWDLKTKVILDDNLSDFVSVRIRASDDTNSSVEKIFQIELLKNNMFTNSEHLAGKIVESSYYGSLKWGSGWRKNPWFGTFYEDSSGWIFHQYLGWVYPANPESNGTLLFLPDVGWTWVNSTIHPYLYSFTNSKWLRLQTMNGQSSRLYDPVAKNWISFEGAKGPPQGFSLSRGELIGPVGMNSEFGVSLRNFAAMMSGFLDNQAFVQDWDQWIINNRPTVTVASAPSSIPASSLLTSSSFYDSNFSKIPSRIRSVRAESDLTLSPLIFGFELEGNHTVAVQGLIPYYPNYGGENVRDPILELFQMGGNNLSIVQNDDWASGTGSALTQSLGLIPAQSKDSSIVQFLNHGKYEARLSGKPNGLGLGMLEYHAADKLGEGQLKRFYVRGKTKNLSTVSFFIEGMEARKILVVAHGVDELAKRGIPGGLPNPTLEMNAPTYVYVDDWEDHYRFAEVKDSGYAPPTGSLDSAVMLDLKPGLHSISVRNYLANKEGVFELSFYDLGKGDENGGPVPPLNLPSQFGDLSYFKRSDTEAYVDKNHSLSVNFTVEGKISTILATGYGEGSIRKNTNVRSLVDPILKFFDREKKIIGQSDNWLSEDKVNELQSGVAYFSPSQGIKDPALFMEQLKPDSYGVNLEAKSNDNGSGSVIISPPDSTKMRIKDLNVTGYVSANQPLKQIVVIEGPSTMRVLIVARGAFSGVSNGLADPKIRIQSGVEKAFEVDNWLDHENAFDLARYANAPKLDSNEPAVLLEFTPSIMWGTTLEVEVFGAIPGSEGNVNLSIYNLGKGTGSLGGRNKDIQYLWNRDLFYQAGDRVSHLGLTFQATQLIPPGTDILSSVHWLNIPVDPVINTEDSDSIILGSPIILKGRVVDSGNLNGLTKQGFLISRSPTPIAGEQSVIELLSQSVNSSGIFEAEVKGLQPGKKYFYQAFGQNMGEDPTGGPSIQKLAYGSVLSFRTPQVNNSPAWAKAQPGAAANWWASPWFGSFYKNDANGSWIMHSELGWLYPTASGKNGVWFWKEQLGWLWTDETFYPFLYQNTSAGWLYFYGASQETMLFYHYRDERWLQMVREGMSN